MWVRTWTAERPSSPHLVSRCGWPWWTASSPATPHRASWPPTSGLGSNLLAHHLRVLEEAGIIRRVRSEGDRRRSYVQLRLDHPTVWAAAISGRMPNSLTPGPRVVFVCTANSARSQLAAAIWNQLSPIPATSAGTHPGPRIHPRAIAVADRHGLRLDTRPTRGPRRASCTTMTSSSRSATTPTKSSATPCPGCTGRFPTRSGSTPTPPSKRAYTDINRRVHHLADLYAPTERAS